MHSDDDDDKEKKRFIYSWMWDGRGRKALQTNYANMEGYTYVKNDKLELY